METTANINKKLLENIINQLEVGRFFVNEFLTLALVNEDNCDEANEYNQELQNELDSMSESIQQLKEIKGGTE